MDVCQKQCASEIWIDDWGCQVCFTQFNPCRRNNSLARPTTPVPTRIKMTEHLLFKSRRGGRRHLGWHRHIYRRRPERWQFQVWIASTTPCIGPNTAIWSLKIWPWGLSLLGRPFVNSIRPHCITIWAVQRGRLGAPARHAYNRLWGVSGRLNGWQFKESKSRFAPKLIRIICAKRVSRVLKPWRWLLWTIQSTSHCCLWHSLLARNYLLASSATNVVPWNS